MYLRGNPKAACTSSVQQPLSGISRRMKIAIYGRITEKLLPQELQGLFDKLKAVDAELFLHHDYLDYLKKQFTIEARVETHDDHNLMRGRVDYLLSIGGDGTLLETIAFVRNSGIPILGINTGRLGFLAALTVQEAVDSAVELIKTRKFSLDKRTLIKLETTTNLFGDVNYALNELTIQRTESSSMMTIHCSVNGEFLNSYWADGLIISTPTGSTAYSLSCGGPLMVPDSRSFVITPLSPHNLNVRPLIVPDDCEILLQVEGRSNRYLASLDSRMASFESGVELRLKKEDFKISLIRFGQHHFFNTIREKLMWGIDRRN